MLRMDLLSGAWQWILAQVTEPLSTDFGVTQTTMSEMSESLCFHEQQSIWFSYRCVVLSMAGTSLGFPMYGQVGQIGLIQKYEV